MCTFGTLCGLVDPVKAIGAMCQTISAILDSEVPDLKNGATEISEETETILSFSSKITVFFVFSVGYVAPFLKSGASVSPRWQQVPGRRLLHRPPFDVE